MNLKSNKLSNYIASSWTEMKKVAWPDRPTTTRLTIVVVAVSLGVAAFLGAIDYILSAGLNKIILRG